MHGVTGRNLVACWSYREALTLVSLSINRRLIHSLLLSRSICLRQTRRSRRVGGGSLFKKTVEKVIIPCIRLRWCCCRWHLPLLAHKREPRGSACLFEGNILGVPDIDGALRLLLSLGRILSLGGSLGGLFLDRRGGFCSILMDVVESCFLKSGPPLLLFPVFKLLNVSCCRVHPRFGHVVPLRKCLTIGVFYSIALMMARRLVWVVALVPITFVVVALSSGRDLFALAWSLPAGSWLKPFCRNSLKSVWFLH